MARFDADVLPAPAAANDTLPGAVLPEHVVVALFASHATPAALRQVATVLAELADLQSFRPGAGGYATPLRLVREEIARRRAARRDGDAPCAAR